MPLGWLHAASAKRGGGDGELLHRSLSEIGIATVPDLLRVGDRVTILRAMAIQIRTNLAEPETGQSFVPHRPERPAKVEGGKAFKLVSEYTRRRATSRRAIAELTEAALAGERDQVLLGVTGSGKTFTMAKVIETLQRPALILAPNKILAAQLYGEMKSFFPDNAVEYFV